jgi:hypothetical protein
MSTTTSAHHLELELASDKMSTVACTVASSTQEAKALAQEFKANLDNIARLSF